MKNRMILAGVAALALVAGAVVGGWYVLEKRPPVFCEISGRPIHANMLTQAKVDGKRLYTCCARCPLTLVQQTKQKVELLEVTDFATGRRLAARDAYFVDGSDVHMCSTPQVKRGAEATPYERLFDRCEPSLIAFAGEQEARDFITQHGGRLQRLNELLHIVPAQPSSTGQRHD